ncbi:4-(cytidine 5'-diphospho)-2-C-methyl-D-erythritol kinase [Aminipila luticellarii]|uniref:4-diphosphocytidyl-2-C-methyl-D-erythritol kinase n=1 Tax=Aminipila luticellarii TaxID=2507160 RepID=A0A410PSD2_9FIRM|nr:4-(cytidine 5'-diphospho)-2-C-methyl-D-erythritol kinase [Aminipila luticellarii]QAT41872.1 4-(cytidine 5'-diphospho)-2-C-methyl-D-erythritol kinase [Aminipila luticellarii]
MKEITIKSYAKINLSLDVLGVLPNGYHQVEMIMQQLELHDLVTVKWTETREQDQETILLTANKSSIPLNRENLAYKAAEIMCSSLHKTGKIEIHIEKNIPVAAGLAGGSGNAAAVLHALNYLWDTGLSVRELCETGLKLGADVPFCIMGQAKGNVQLGSKISEDSLACTCALAEGIGEKLTPVTPLCCEVLLSKPPIGISTAEVYKGIDAELGLGKPANGEAAGKVQRHLRTEELIDGLNSKNCEKIAENMLNVLELFSAKRYPIIMYTKDKIIRQGSAAKVLMSGSGPTVFAIYFDGSEPDGDYKLLCEMNEETYVTRTLVK